MLVCSWPDLGCIHLRAEWYLSTGANTPLPNDWPNAEYPACGDKCWVCKRSYQNDMLPITYEGAIAFLDSEYFSAKECMPYAVTHEEKELITNKLWESADWKKRVFGLKNVSKYNINSFFFQLVGTGIITFK